MIQEKTPQGTPIRLAIPFIFFVATLLFVTYAQAQTLCPDCFKDQVPIGDNGVNSAGQNQVIVKIDDSWKTNGTIDQTILLSVKGTSVTPDGGVDLWNKEVLRISRQSISSSMTKTAQTLISLSPKTQG